LRSGSGVEARAPIAAVAAADFTCTTAADAKPGKLAGALAVLARLVSQSSRGRPEASLSVCPWRGAGPECVRARQGETMLADPGPAPPGKADTARCSQRRRAKISKLRRGRSRERQPLPVWPSAGP